MLSTKAEEAQFRKLIKKTLSGFTSCDMRWRTVAWPTIQAAREQRAQPLAEACTHADQYNLQTAKKLYGLLYYGFERALVLDAEGAFVKATSLKEVFNTPRSYWLSLHSDAERNPNPPPRPPNQRQRPIQRIQFNG